MTSSGLVDWKRSYELSPIFLVGGIASQVPGQTIPIISLTEAGSFDTGLLSGGNEIGLDDFFGAFTVVPGGTLIENEFSTYPFANQIVAANAVIVQPLRISLLMTCPARGPGGFPNKTATFAALQRSLAQHIQLGGWFNVLTPALFYGNLLLNSLRDVTQGRPDQPQSQYQWDFFQPLLTKAQAAVAYSASLSKIAAQVPSSGDPPALSGGGPNVASTASGVTPAVVPAAGSTMGAAGAGGSPAPPLAFPNFGP